MLATDRKKTAAKKSVKKTAAKKTAKKKATKKVMPAKKRGINIIPLDDRVILRMDTAEALTPGGIILPVAAQEQSAFATVVAIGQGAPWKEYVITPQQLHPADPLASQMRDELRASQLLQPRYPMTVKKGDRVMIGRFAGAPMELQDEAYTIVREADILCICAEE